MNTKTTKRQILTEQPAPEEEPEEALSVGLSGPVATLVAIAAWAVGLWMGVTL